MTKLNNFLQLIEIENFRLHKGGLQIDYVVFGTEQTINANPTQAADLLQQAGYIEDYSGAGDEVSVELERVFDTVNACGEHEQKADYVQLYWEDYVNDVRFTEKHALVIAAMFEEKKSIQSPTEQGPLTKKENDLLETLSVVSDKTIWGLMIHKVKQEVNPFRVRLLFKELKEQAGDDPIIMSRILGKAYSPLMQYKA